MKERKASMRKKSIEVQNLGHMCESYEKLHIMILKCNCIVVLQHSY